MLVFINIINHKVISLLTQVQKKPQKRLGPQSLPLCMLVQLKEYPQTSPESSYPNQKGQILSAQDCGYQPHVKEQMKAPSSFLV